MELIWYLLTWPLININIDSILILINFELTLTWYWLTLIDIYIGLYWIWHWHKYCHFQQFVKIWVIMPTVHTTKLSILIGYDNIIGLDICKIIVHNLIKYIKQIFYTSCKNSCCRKIGTYFPKYQQCMFIYMFMNFSSINIL